MENSTDLISIIDASGNYKFVAGSVKPILGYEPGELVGTNALSYIHCDDQRAIAMALERAVSGKQSTLPPFRFRTKDNEYCWVECSVTDMLANEEVRGYVTNSRVISAQVMEAEERRRSQAHYESLFYNHPDAVFELDRNGAFVRVNKSVSRVLQQDESQILGFHFQKFVHERDMPTASGAFLNTMAGSSEYVEISIVREAGEAAILGITVFPVVIDGQIVSIQGIAKDITQQKRHEVFLQEQAGVVSSIMERINEAFYVLDGEWRYTYVNNFYCSYMGKAREELLGGVIWETFPKAVGTQFYHECRKVAQLRVTAKFQGASPYKPDSAINFQIFPSLKGVAVHFVDVTELKREKDRLEKLSLVASKSTTSIMIKDAGRRIEWANEAFENATGYAPEDYACKSFPEFLSGEETDKGTIAKIIRRMEGGKPFEGEILNYAKSGEEIWFHLQVTPVFDQDGRLSKFVSIRTDITQRKREQQELTRLAKDLYEQNMDLQQFSYMVSHNLRAPAANIMGLSSVLEILDKDSAMFSETLSRVKESARILDRVIRDMNQILSIRDRSTPLTVEEIEVQSVLGELITKFRFEASGHTYAIHASTKGGASGTVRLNRVYLYEALSNLLANSVKFRKKDEALHVAVSIKHTEAKTVLTISDNGIGFDSDAVKDGLFKLYKQFHSGYEGRGVGLFLTKTYLNAMNCTVKVTSAVNQGTSYKIKIKR